MGPSESEESVRAIKLTTVVARNESLLTAEVGAELVMLHVENNAYYDTNAIGADLWRRLAQPIRVQDLCEALVSEYEVDPGTCQADVLGFLNDAHKEGLIRIV